jgi:hypothetical protein
MAINPFGDKTSRFLESRDRQYAGVIFEAGKPPLDSELNLSSFIDLESRSEQIRSQMPSGWIMSESNPKKDFYTNPKNSNQFFFGVNRPGEKRNPMWAVVNGWTVPVTGTRTGYPPLQSNDQDTWNRITLNPPSTSTGGNRVEFVFLEVWLSRIDVDPASVGLAPGKPERGFIYKFGNVEGGFSFFPDDLIDPEINSETTNRVQVQYRIRVSADINLAQYPDGFDPTSVFAQGSLSTQSTVSFINMREELGDPGLWRAGTGDPSTFGTVDGYVYAIPICSVFRRNGAGFSDVGNLAGAFNRNSKAILRSDATSFNNPVILSSPIVEEDGSFNLTTISGTVLQSMSSFGEAYFRLDDEIIRITQISQLGPTSYSISIERGQLQTVVRQHKEGTNVVPYTVRPDGLFADQISSTDILDLRHSVKPSRDYEQILKTNTMELLRGSLRTSWKRFGSTNSAGPVVFYGDRITDSSVFVGGLSRLDSPNGNRRIFSDASCTERYNVPVSVPNNSNALGNSIQVQVSPYNITVEWIGSPFTHAPGNRLSGGLFPSWWNGDTLRIRLSDFQAGLPTSDSDQVRFVLPVEDSEPDAVTIRFEGMTTDPNGPKRNSTSGYIEFGSSQTSESSTVPNFTSSLSGNPILKHGKGILVSKDSSGNLIILLDSGTDDSEMQEFLDALQGNTSSSFAQNVNMHIQFSVMYGPGRGLSHKPDHIHSAHFRGSPTNSSKVMLRSGLTDRGRLCPTYLVESPLVQTGKNRNLSRTSELMVDPGSKSVYVAPYRNLLIPQLLCRDGDKLNWYSNNSPSISFQGCMPIRSPDGSVIVNPVVDPLTLFYSGSSDSRYVEIPFEYLPRPGLHHIPIIPTTNGVFPSGINFLLMSKEGPNVNNSDRNMNLISYPSSAGYSILTPKVGETYGTSPGSSSVFGQKYTNKLISSHFGGPFRGIKFPPFYAPARITGIYLRQGSSITPVSSPFDSNRKFIGQPGSDLNLMRDSFDGPTVLMDVDSNGDCSFILNADVIDFKKSTPGTTFDNSEFIVECTLFGFDRGFLQTNGRLVVSKASSGGSSPVAVNTFTTSSDLKIGIISPAPMSINSSNNEVTIFYSRSPYQGDVFGTKDAYSDDLQRVGPIQISEYNSLKSNSLVDPASLSLKSKSGYEILCSSSFVTSLGTGRMSGSVPIPLLSTDENPQSPKDYMGSLVDLDRRFSLNRVSYEDWSTPKFPVSDSVSLTRPKLVRGALDEVFDNDCHPEFAGCVSNLPLGSFFRDKDFCGKTLYQTRSASNIGIIPLGSFSFVDYETSAIQPSQGHSTWEGVEYVCGSSSSVTGSGTDSIIRIDGSSSSTDSNNFRTTRGGAGYMASGLFPGGPISSKFPKSRPNKEVGSVLLCTSYLVKSMPESNSTGEVHHGSELQMIVVTQAVPSYFRDNDMVHSASGIGEGYTAVDRFRILGRPLERNSASVDMSVVPSERPVFVNRIFGDPLFFGSSDISLNSQNQESLSISSNGQTSFSLSKRPLDPKSVQLFYNGVKQQYGVDYVVGGSTNQSLTLVSSILVSTLDVLEVWYLLFLSPFLDSRESFS